jgi:F-type H+-transporting ATPase subunit epsilon
MHVVIAKVDEVYFDGEAIVLIAPGSAGQLTVLARHMPLITTLKAGTLVVRTSAEDKKEFPIESGVLEVRHDGATVIL